jgi:hypothetical protein
MKTLITMIIALTMSGVVAHAQTDTASTTRRHCDQQWRSMCCARDSSHFQDNNCRDFRAEGCCPQNDDIGYCADPNVTIDVNVGDNVGKCADQPIVVNPPEVIIDSAIGACLEQPIQICDQVGKCAEPQPEPPANFFSSICPQYFAGEPFPTWNCMKVHHLAMKGRRHKAESMQICAALVAKCIAHGNFPPLTQ